MQEVEPVPREPAHLADAQTRVPGQVDGGMQPTSATRRGPCVEGWLAREKLLTTGELAEELGVSAGAILKWTNADPPLITPAWSTPGGPPPLAAK